MNSRFKIYLLSTCLYALLIFYLSSRSSLGDPEEIFNLLNIKILGNFLHSIEHSDLRFLLYPFYIFSLYPDKIQHIILYAGFGFLIHSSLKNSSNPALMNYAIMFSVIIGTIYGISDEFHQSFVPGRTASAWDLLADAIGLTIAQIIIFAKESNICRGKVKRSIMPEKKGIHDIDLKLCVIFIILSILFILIPPYNQSFLRIILALPLLLFLPGYLLMAVMFPKRGELSPIERFTLSIGLSIAITVFDGFALNYTRWGFRPNSIVISLSLIIGLLLIGTIVQRWRLKGDAYELSTEDLASFFRIIRSKETGTGPENDPALEKMLIITMIIAILLVSAMLIYAKVTTEPEKFTAFYILGSKGKAEDYPSEVYINKPAKLLVGIENYEHQPVNYTLRVQLDGRILKEQPVLLAHESKWLENVTFIPWMTSSIAMAGADPRSKLEFVLLKDNIPYRSVHLWVKPIFNINEFIASIILINGDMEQTTGWNFNSSGKNVTGNYTNISWISPLRSFQINLDAASPGEYGELFQNITVDKESLAILSFFVKDSYSNTTSNISKQVLLDKNIVWEEGLGNNSWRKIQVPVFFSKNTRLAFRVQNTIALNDTAQVWWDDIGIEPYVELTKDIPDKTITRPVVLTSFQQFEFNIRGMPIKMKGDATIDGSNFPGFFYNIDENRSYEKLFIYFSDSSTIEPGNATYISTMHGDEISLTGSSYKIINKDDIGTLSKVLMKNAGATLNLGENWNLDNGYAISLGLISSKGDTAMLELLKGGSIVDSRLVSVGEIFEYRASVAGYSATIFKTEIDSIAFNSVKVKDTELYSDNPIILKDGDSIGDFEVTNISSSEITMKNSYPIKINDGSVLLGGNIGFRVIDDMAFPYAAYGEIRGSPQSTLPGSSLNINGLSYPGFHYDLNDKISTEELSMHFSYNATVDAGKAVYKTRRQGDEIYFLGNPYWLPNPQRINFISRTSKNTKIMPRNGTLGLEDGFTLSLKERPDGSAEVFIKKNMTKSTSELINRINISGLLKDFYYEIFTTTFKNGRVKSNVMYEAGDEFEYWIEYEEDRKYKIISGEITGMDNNNVTLKIEQNQIPGELVPGMTFGEFEIESISNDTISLKNIKPLKFEPGKETAILGGEVRIRTSSKEPIAYATRGRTN
ncbi:MAG: VanZ family protein [Candidatus Methanoperedens sp.]|nr:VanZ family protein [Candidatus Methanoperedens sp.]